MNATQQIANDKDRWPLIYGATVAEVKSMREWGIKGDCWSDGMERDYVEWIETLEELRIEQCVLRALGKWAIHAGWTVPATEPPLDLKDQAVFKLFNDCLDLDKGIRRPPPHYAVLKAALVDGMNTYDMARINRWPRKTAELRLKNIETNLLHNHKVNNIRIDPAIFRNVDAQLKLAQEHGAKIYRPALLENTTAHKGSSQE